MFSGLGSNKVIFLKDVDEVNRNIKLLKIISEKITNEANKKEIENHIKNIEKGFEGEAKIKEKLSNCGLPMIVIPSLSMEYRGTSTQIDYLVITKKNIYILECKNYSNDIYLDNKGEFYLKSNNKLTKTSSPITQADVQMNKLKSIIKGETCNSHLDIAKFDSEDDRYNALVIITNDETQIDDSDAPLKQQDRILSIDRMIMHFLNNDNETSKEKSNFDDKDIDEIVTSLLNCYEKSSKKYLNKYNDILEAELSDEKINCPDCGCLMVKRTAQSGPNAGNEFYGCSEYPNCKKIVNLDQAKPAQPQPLETTQAPVQEQSDVVNCPDCGSDMVIKVAKSGPNVGNEFYGCSKYPNCKKIVNIDQAKPAQPPAQPQPLETTQPPVQEQSDVVNCPDCGSNMVIKVAKSGPNAGNEFYGCSKYPNCKKIVNLDQAKPAQPQPLETTQPPAQNIAPINENNKKVTCPECGKEMIERKSGKNNFRFYGCKGYPDCKKKLNLNEVNV